jgi:hypothetical protein
MKHNNPFQAISGVAGTAMRTQRNNHRRWITATLVAAAVTAAPIGLAPSASAKGVAIPGDVCTGSEMAANGCISKPVRVGPGHVVAPKWEIRTYPSSSCVRSPIGPKQPALAECQLPDSTDAE